MYALQPKFARSATLCLTDSLRHVASSGRQTAPKELALQGRDPELAKTLQMEAERKLSLIG